MPNPSNLVGEPDGSDGAILVWLMADTARIAYTIQAQRIAANGSVLWGADGISFGSASGPVAYLQTAWIQLVPDGNGGAIVLSPQAAGAATDYVAYAIDGSGALVAGPVTVVAGVPNGWVANLRLRHAVADGAGGLFLAYADSQGQLHLVRYQPAQGVVWDVGLGLLIHPAAFHVYEDDRGGVLITFISPAPQLELRRIDGNGRTTWDINTAQAGTPLRPIIPISSGAWPADHWSRFAQAVPKGDGGAILLFQVWPGSGAKPRIHSICFDSQGVRVDPEQEITARPTAQELPTAIPVGGAAVVAWADDGNAASTGLDVWSQRVGCCPPTTGGGLEHWPPFGCEIVDFSNAGFGGLILKFPCGNRDLQLGLIPLSRLAVNLRGPDFPPSVTCADAPAPDWMRLSFSGLPRETTVHLLTTTGKVIAEGKSVRQRGADQLVSSLVTLTFRPDREDPLLVFTNTGKRDRDAQFLVRMHSEWGDGKPPALPRLRTAERMESRGKQREVGRSKRRSG
jgi:hypothetical protein